MIWRTVERNSEKISGISERLVHVETLVSGVQDETDKYGTQLNQLEEKTRAMFSGAAPFAESEDAETAQLANIRFSHEPDQQVNAVLVNPEA